MLYDRAPRQEKTRQERRYVHDAESSTLSSPVSLSWSALRDRERPPGSRRNGRGAVHVSQDGLIDAITPDGFDHVYRPVYREAEDAVARAALQAGHTVIVDRTNRTRAHRERWLHISRVRRRVPRSRW